MTEIKTELKVVAHLEEMLCDICGYGRMIHTGVCLTSLPLKYQHKCDSCQWEGNYLKSYPCKSFDAVPFGENE